MFVMISRFVARLITFVVAALPLVTIWGCDGDRAPAMKKPHPEVAVAETAQGHMPIAAQEPSRARDATPLPDLDHSVETLVRIVDPTVVEVFNTELASASGVVLSEGNLVTTKRS